MFVTLKSLLRTLLLPPAGPLLVAFLGVWLVGARSSTRARGVGWGLLLAALASLWLLATPVVADLLQRAAEREPALDLGKPVQAQAIVILGGGYERHWAPEYGGQPAAAAQLLERLAYGAFIAHRTGLPILVSGTFTEGEAMRASLVRDFAVQPRWVDGDSRDTFENAQFSSRLLRHEGVTRVVLVTSATHERRAVREFESAGLTVVPAPVGLSVPHRQTLLRYLPSVAGLAESTEALYELLGEVARQVFVVLHLRGHAP